MSGCQEITTCYTETDFVFMHLHRSCHQTIVESAFSVFKSLFIDSHAILLQF